MRRRPLAFALLGTVLSGFLAASAVAQGASSRHLRGVLDSVSESALQLTARNGEKIEVGITAATPVVLITPSEFGAIKPGSYIGTAAVPGRDGALRASEVHVFAETMRGVGEGHTPWGDEPQTTMTNGTVGEVAGRDGRTLRVTYKGGQQEILVDPETPVVAIDRASHDLLKPGAHVVVIANATEGGALRARFVQVGRDGFDPPL